MNASGARDTWVVWRGALMALGAALAGAVGGCGGGSNAASPDVQPAAPSCSGACANAASFLTVAEVETVLARAVAEAQARAAPATIAVVDRVGNVLAVFAMAGASATVTVGSGGAPIDGGLEGVTIVPATLAAIAKAITGAYLSSEGNAFTSRTASQIVQQHFNPGEALAPGGPLLGVQFSQLACSDLATRFAGGAPGPGPHRSPLGLAADPGGVPLYKDGTIVGGVGVIADGVYGLDPNVQDRDLDTDEAVALAGSFGLAAPDDRRADRITVDGKTLRFSDVQAGDLQSTPASAPGFGAINGIAGSLVAVTGYAAATIVAGTAYGQPASGLRADAALYPGLEAYVLVDAANAVRYPPIAGTEPVDALTASEARTLLTSALTVANRSRAQIRRPLDARARVNIALVDSNGVVLGAVSSRDAPVFGVDVSLQKARTAAFLAAPGAAAALTAQPDAVYLDGGLTVLRSVPIGEYVTALRAFLGLPLALSDGVVAYSARSVGNLARVNYPDGVDGNPPGPLAKPAGEWSPFSTGLQLDLSYNAIVQHVAYVLGAAPDVPQNCTGIGGFNTGFAPATPIAGLANGLQIFPGGVPLYRNGVLVGALGVSGDGIDQDDMVAFLGAAQAALPGITNAPPDRRADQLVPAGARLRYVSCPQAPFLDSNVQEPCGGL